MFVLNLPSLTGVLFSRFRSNQCRGRVRGFALHCQFKAPQDRTGAGGLSRPSGRLGFVYVCGGLCMYNGNGMKCYFIQFQSHQAISMQLEFWNRRIGTEGTVGLRGDLIQLSVRSRTCSQDSCMSGWKHVLCDILNLLTSH